MVFNTIDQYVVDFPKERVLLRLMEYNHTGEVWYWEQTKNWCNGITNDKRVYQKYENDRLPFVEYARKKKILDSCFDKYYHSGRFLE